jgi:hypothetical protein
MYQYRLPCTAIYQVYRIPDVQAAVTVEKHVLCLQRNMSSLGRETCPRLAEKHVLAWQRKMASLGRETCPRLAEKHVLAWQRNMSSVCSETYPRFAANHALLHLQAAVGADDEVRRLGRGPACIEVKGLHGAVSITTGESAVPS